MTVNLIRDEKCEPLSPKQHYWFYWDWITVSQTGCELLEGTLSIMFDSARNQPADKLELAENTLKTYERGSGMVSSTQRKKNWCYWQSAALIWQCTCAGESLKTVEPLNCCTVCSRQRLFLSESNNVYIKIYKCDRSLSTRFADSQSLLSTTCFVGCIC